MRCIRLLPVPPHSLTLQGQVPAALSTGAAADGGGGRRGDRTASNASLGCRFQLRCLLGQPLTVAAGGVVTGELRLVAHKRQSYDVHLTLSAPPLLPGDSPQTVLARCGTCSIREKHWCVLQKQQLYHVHLTLSAPPLLPSDSPQTVLACWLLCVMQCVHKGKT